MGAPPSLNAIAERRAQREARAERLAFILDGRRRGLSYATIGAACDPPISQQRVHQLYQKALAEIPAANLAELRKAERERLENLLARYEEITGRFTPLVVGGQIVTNPKDGLPLRDLRPVMEALRGIQSVGESLRKLDGMDAPARHEVTGETTVHYKVVGVSAEELDAL